MATSKKRRASGKRAVESDRKHTTRVSGRVVHTLPDGVPAIFSDGLIVTHTPQEFVMSFLQTRWPLASTPEEGRATQEIESRCIVRIVVTPFQMGRIVDALQNNFGTFVKNWQAMSKEEE